MDKVVDVPIVVQCVDKVVDVPVVQVPQFIDGLDVAVIMPRQVYLSRSGSASESVHRLSLQTFQLQQRRVPTVRTGFWRVFRIFRAPPGSPGVERHFSEPSIAKSSLPSRAPAQ